MADKIKIKIVAKTMEGLPASDPQVTIMASEVSQPGQEVAVVNIKDFTGSETIAIDTPDSFPTWQVNATFSRFDGGPGFFFMPRGNPG